jgi:hypothetical protein
MEKQMMRTNNMKLEAFMVRLACGFASVVLLLLLVGLLLLVAGFAGSSFAEESQPRTFSSPGEATDETGAQEILFRRIGENEAAAIQVCEEFAITKKDQDAKPPSYDPITQFAENLVSADATNAGSKGSSPFHGYYFRIVNGNSAAATSHYASGGDKKTGLVLVAYPAEYRSSGVKTFIVTRHDIVYEKDLGPNTTTVAPSIKARNSSWRPAE